MKSIWCLLFVMVAIPSCMSEPSSSTSGGGCNSNSGGSDDCWFLCGDGGGGGGGGGGSGGDDCGFDCVFAFEAVRPIGVGTVADLGHRGPDALVFVVESSDPAIAEVAVDGGGIHVAARAAGVAKLTARDAATDEVLDEVEVTTVDVAAIELHFRPVPGLDEVVTGIAGIAGSRDAFSIVYRSEAGESLAGRGEFEVTGEPISIAGAPAFYRLSDLVVQRAQVELAFGDPGTGTLVAKLIGLPLRATFPIEVVSKPASLEVVMVAWRGGPLMPAPDPVLTSDFVGGEIVGRTTDGRYVGGVTATWSASSPIPFTTPAGPITEVVFKLDPAGRYDLEATVGTTSITTRLTSQ